MIVVTNGVKNDPLWATAILAHEAGHATADPEYIATITAPQPGENYSQWYEEQLYGLNRGEAHAGLTTAQVRLEILGNGGPDIDNIDDITKSTYDRYAAGDLTWQAAVDLLADHRRGQPSGYRDRLEKAWEDFTGSPPPPPDPSYLPNLPDLPDPPDLPEMPEMPVPPDLPDPPNHPDPAGDAPRNDTGSVGSAAAS
ncbi:hypothetical protein AB0B25_04630 [Nocardia sp. NPDC049190]|uniref:hypothetical protein n=1 Tax=Nocardia sp. NPDC049190 TaxID=3155650 RepID=UPI003410E5C0